MATKSKTKTNATTSRAKTLAPRDRVTSRNAQKETPEERRKRLKREAAKRHYEKKKAERAAAAKSGSKRSAAAQEEKPEATATGIREKLMEQAERIQLALALIDSLDD